MDLKASGSTGDHDSSGIRLDARTDLAQLPVQNLQLTGTAQVQAVLRGTITNPEVDGTIRTTDATVRTAGMSEPAAIRTNVDFTRDQFVIRNMDAEFVGATAQIEGRGNLKGAGDFEFRAENIRPERLFTDRPLSGLVSLEGKVSLSKPSIEGLTASARVTQLELFVRDVRFIRLNRSNFRLKTKWFRFATSAWKDRIPAQPFGVMQTFAIVTSTSMSM